MQCSMMTLASDSSTDLDATKQRHLSVKDRN